MAQTWDVAGNEANFFVRDSTGGPRLPFRIRPGAPTSSIDVARDGNVGLQCSSPDHDLTIGGTGAGCDTGTFSEIDAGETDFTVSSSRAIKENLRPVRVPDVLARIAAVDVYTYDFIDGAKDRMGLMAEDFHTVFGRGSQKLIKGQEVEMALWLAVQELTARNEALARRNEELDRRLAEIEARLAGAKGE